MINVRGKSAKTKKKKLLKKGRKEWHLPNSCLQTTIEYNEFIKNRQKNQAFGQYCDFH